MTIQIDSEFIRVGTVVLKETPTGIVAMGAVRTLFGNVQEPQPERGTVAGFTSGGYVSSIPPNPGRNNIDKFPFATNANATDYGDLTVGRWHSTGVSSEVSGYTGGGVTDIPFGANISNIIDKFPFASNANATDVGDLSSVNFHGTPHNSESYGYFTSGSNTGAGASGTTSTQRFLYSNDTSLTTVPSVLTVIRYEAAGQSSPVNAYTCGGNNGGATAPPNGSNIIDKFQFASNSTKSDVGDMTIIRRSSNGNSSEYYGYTSGGISNGVYNINVIDRFPFASDSNASDVGDLGVGGSYGSSNSSTTDGYVLHGRIDKFPFATNSNTTFVGNLTLSRSRPAGTQD